MVTVHKDATLELTVQNITVTQSLTQIQLFGRMRTTKAGYLGKMGSVHYHCHLFAGRHHVIHIYLTNKS